MSKVSFLIIMTITWTFNSFLAECFVMPHYGQLIGADYEFAEEEKPVAPTPAPNYIMRITEPSERRTPESDEIIKFIIAKQSNNMISEETANTTDKISSDETAGSDDQQQQREKRVMTYGKFFKLLAELQMENERNAYEMQSRRRIRNAVLRE